MTVYIKRQWGTEDSNAFAAMLDQINKLNADAQSLATGDLLLSTPNLRIGTVSAAKVKYDALIYQIDGMRYRIAAGEVAFTDTTHDIADPDAAGREAIYTLSASVAGAVTITKGADAALGAGVAPATPAGELKIGEVKIAHDGTAIFNANTDLLSAAHLTDTYTDATPFALTSEDVAEIS